MNLVKKGRVGLKTEQQYFEGAVDIAQYMDNMTQLKEGSFTIYNAFEV